MPALKEHATAVFHRQPENLNCAQAVLDAFQLATGRHVADVPTYRAFGGGRAPNNECGALYAACQCAPGAAEEMRADFLARAQATSCRELKRDCRVSCPECVGLAAELLEAHLH